MSLSFSTRTAGGRRRMFSSTRNLTLMTPDLIFGPRNADRYDWFGTLDFRVSYKKEFKKSALTLFFEVSNATNRFNACCLDFETDEDENETVILLTKDEDWYPMLPAVGLLWEF